MFKVGDKIYAKDEVPLGYTVTNNKLKYPLTVTKISNNYILVKVDDRDIEEVKKRNNISNIFNEFRVNSIYFHKADLTIFGELGD